MPDTVTKRAGVPIGLERLVVWPLIEDSKNSLEYGDVHEFDKILMTCQDDPSISEGSLFADNVEVDSISIIEGGKIVLGITLLTSGERVMLYGEAIKNGTNVTNIDNLSDYVGVGCMTKRADGKHNLKKYFKVKFIPGSESNETVSKSGVKYATQQITGNYTSLIHNGDSRAIRHAVDINTDKEIVDQWFTDAKYIGPEDASSEPETTNTTTGDENTDG